MSKIIYDIFISYSSKDQKVAEGICAYLEQRHFRCFVAYRDIPKAKVWASAIVEALEESRMMVVLFSKNFNVSEQVDREIELAADDHKPILTFRLSNDAFQGAKRYYLKNINWIDAFPEPDKCFGELAEEVEKLLGSPIKDDSPSANEQLPKPDGKVEIISEPKPEPKPQPEPEPKLDGKKTVKITEPITTLSEQSSSTRDISSSSHVTPHHHPPMWVDRGEATGVPTLKSNWWLFILMAAVAIALGMLIPKSCVKNEPAAEETTDTVDSQTPPSPPKRGTSARSSQRGTSAVVEEATTGIISISSTPTGAAVKVGDRYKGDTPIDLDNLKPGRYKVEISMVGYEPYTETVKVTAGKTATSKATLKKKQEASTQTPPSPPQGGTNAGSSQGRTSASGLHMDGNTLCFTVDGTEYSYKMVYVSGGTFTMGCTDEQGECGIHEKPAHSVTVSGFYMGQTEVTQALWKAVMGDNPSHWKGDTLPVENVSWEDCQEFIKQLNKKTGKTFRMPTEAEWEYAARGGRKSLGYKYAGGHDIDKVAWYDGNSGSKTHPVKGKKANELGLYDMSGNVMEWCQDCFGSYSGSAHTNSSGPSSGCGRVLRGGSWYLSAWGGRVACRIYFSPDIRMDDLGFRLALVASSSSAGIPHQ